jgi:hypothetical protein
MPALQARGVKTEEVKRLGSVDMVKRHNKNEFTHHLTPHAMHPMRRRIRQPYPKWAP